MIQRAASSEMSLFILSIGILLTVIIRFFFILNGLDVADVNKAHEVSKLFLQGGNPYQSLLFATYPPINYYITTSTLFLSNLLSLPFHILIKLWPNLADIVIGIILYKLLIRLKTKPLNASVWALVFLLNPISIIISAAHGQIDSVPTLLALTSVYLLIFHTTKNHFLLSALSLGLAIAIKPNPLMLLPVFLIINTSLKQKLIFTLTSLAPLVISVSPFLWNGTYQILTKVFGYSGVYDFGYAAILRSFLFQQNANIWLPNSAKLLSISKFIFLIGLLLTILLFIKSKNLVKGCLAIYLLFLGLYFGISAQYLSWVLPFAVLERDKMIIPFSLFGTFALLGFYIFFGPDILLGRFSTITAFQTKYMPIYVIGNLTLWITILIWLAKIIIGQVKLVKQS